MYTLIPADAIAQRIRELGREISSTYPQASLTLVGVLHGSVIFMADLMREITVPHRIGFLQASSYRGTATRPGELTVETRGLPGVRDRDVLLVDDILDTGRTLVRVRQELFRLGARSVRTAVLLWKQERTEVELKPDFVGFPIPDVFVVGYGLDYDDDYRHLPMIQVLESADLATGPRS